MGPLASLAMAMVPMGQESAPHPGAADSSLHLCPGYCFWWQLNCCPCSLASSLGWERPWATRHPNPLKDRCPLAPTLLCASLHDSLPCWPPLPHGIISVKHSLFPPSQQSCIPPPCPALTSGGSVALSLLVGEIQEVSLGMSSGSICSSVVQLMASVPGSRTFCLHQPHCPSTVCLCCCCWKKTIWLLPATGSWCCLPEVRALWAQMEEGGKHPAAETSPLGHLQPGQGPELPFS